MNAEAMNTRMVAAADRLRKAQVEYEIRISDHVDAEREYKKGFAVALLQVEGRNAEERAANAELRKDAQGVTPNELRYAAHLAEGLRDAAKLAVQNYRQELSALQSIASLTKEEMMFDRTAPAEVIGT